MNLEAAIDVLRAHRAARGLGPLPAAGRPRLPGSQAALRALRDILPADQRWHADGDDMLARLAGGRVLAIGLDASPQVNGSATRDGALRRASIDEGFARAVFELAVAMWSNPAFLPEVGPVPTALAAPSAFLPVPRGLEYVAASAQPGLPALTRIDEVPLPGWLWQGLASMAAERLRAFERTALHAMRFMLQHELGHVLLGHLEFVPSTAGRSLLEEAPGHARPPSGTVAPGATAMRFEARRAFEIEADRHAALALFAPTRTGGANGAATGASSLALLGAILAMVVFVARDVFEERADPGITHPPLWFRTHDIVATAFSSRQPAATGGLDSSPMGAQARATLDRLLASVGATHPMIGEWVCPVADGRFSDSARRVLKEARHARADFLRGRVRVRETIVAASAPD